MNYTERMKDLREDKDLKQSDIAKILNMKQQQYSEYERGFRETPVQVIIRLCLIYNVSADYILGFTNEMIPLPKDGKKI